MMFSVQKVQNFPAARAKSDAKGKKIIDFYLAPKIFTQIAKKNTQLSDEKKTLVWRVRQ